MENKNILGIDPGQNGAFVLVRDFEFLQFAHMPLTPVKDVCFESVRAILRDMKPDHVFLERAMPMAMGSKHAFNYGRGFAALEIAIRVEKLSVTYVEPAKWMREMHEGISSDLKPKAKSLIALERLYAPWMAKVPRSSTGKYHDGVVDALLIAGFGQRKLGFNQPPVKIAC